QLKEVQDAKEKWNKEGAPEESQANYRKNNLKKNLDEFSELLRRTMGCHVVMLVSHKKRTDQSLNVVLHETHSQNDNETFFKSSEGVKNWAAQGAELFAEWSKGKFYPTGDEDDKPGSDEEDSAQPEVNLDDQGYATLPSRKNVNLKGQQELIRKIFAASYSELHSLIA
ncbi:hypothetical protein AZE42_13680, partial [Rhizopogon vesiculosus]